MSCGPGERLINPQADTCTYQLLVDHDLQDRAIMRFIYVAAFTLEIMTFGVWHERDSAKAGAEATFSNKRAQMGVSDPTLCIERRYPPKRDIIVMRP